MDASGHQRPSRAPALYGPILIWTATTLYVQDILHAKKDMWSGGLAFLLSQSLVELPCNAAHHEVVMVKHPQ